MSHSFAQWLRESHRDQRGTIQQPQGPLRIAYIRPDAFPEERIFFRYDHWTTTRTHRALQNRAVIFDLEPQEWNPMKTPDAINVRIAPVTPPTPETRPSYTTRS
jgi:hypothetical protein